MEDKYGKAGNEQSKLQQHPLVPPSLNFQRRLSVIPPPTDVKRIQSKEEQHAFAGGMAGFIAGLLLYPAEVVSMRYKVGGTRVFQKMIRTESPLAFWYGVDAGLLGTIPTTAMYFVAYEGMKEIGEATLPTSLHPLVHMTSGATSELMSSVVYVPFEVVKQRMMLGKNPHAASDGHIDIKVNYKNSFQAFKSIYQVEGRRGLYAGYLPCIITDMSFRGFQFLLYELGKKKFNLSADSDAEEPSTLKDLIVGFGAGACSAVITNPCDIVTVNLMVERNHQQGSTSKAFRKLFGEIKTEGMRVLFRGALWRAISLAPHSAITFAVFEYTLRWMKRVE